MRHQVALALLLFHSAIGIRQSAFSDVPQLINYQGRLLDGTNLVTDNVELSLRLFNVPTGGSALYEDSNTVKVVDGLYATFIGDDPVNDSFVVALTNAEVWVEVAVDGLTLAPRERVASVAYALSLRGLRATTNASFVFNPAVNALAGSASNTTVGGGEGHVVRADASHVVVAGGFEHLIGTNAAYAAIGGGYDNRILEEARYSVIAGGIENLIERGAGVAAIAGGVQNTIGTNAGYSFIGGGTANQIKGQEGALVGGSFNLIESSGVFIGGGADNVVRGGSPYALVVGGSGNVISNNATRAALVGGADNLISTNAGFAFLGGGQGNLINGRALHAVLAGGLANTIERDAQFAVIAGGRSNRVGVAATNALAAGYRARADHRGTFVWADLQESDFATTASNQFLVRASGGVGLGTTAPEAPLHVAQGASGADPAEVGALMVAEGGSNTYLTIKAPTNCMQGLVFATARSNHDAAIVYNFGNERSLRFRTSGSITRMIIATNGNVGIGTTSLLTNRLTVSGNIQCTALFETSDRSAKENFDPVDPQAVLQKITALPITEWSFKDEPGVRHIGPMAQDFYAAFGLGQGATTISSIDRAGVALAAIQALAKENAEFRVTNAELRERLEKLERELQAIRQEHSR